MEWDEAIRNLLGLGRAKKEKPVVEGHGFDWAPVDAPKREGPAYPRPETCEVAPLSVERFASPAADPPGGDETPGQVAAEVPEGVVPQASEAEAPVAKEQMAEGSDGEALGSEFDGMRAALDSLSEHVVKQATAITRLVDAVQPLGGIENVVGKALEAHAEAVAHAKRLAVEVRSDRARREADIAREAEERARRETLDVLFDVREMLERGLQLARNGAPAKPGTKILKRLAGNAPDQSQVVSAIEKCYLVSIERIDEALDRLEVSEINCLNRAYDANLMVLTDVEETKAAPDGTVIEVLRMGYMRGGEVIRQAHVKVARAPK